MPFAWVVAASVANVVAEVSIVVSAALIVVPPHELQSTGQSCRVIIPISSDRHRLVDVLLHTSGSTLPSQVARVIVVVLVLVVSVSVTVVVSVDVLVVVADVVVVEVHAPQVAGHSA